MRRANGLAIAISARTFVRRASGVANRGSCARSGRFIAVSSRCQRSGAPTLCTVKSPLSEKNGGDSIVRPSVPSHLVAAMPYRYVPGDGRYEWSGYLPIKDLPSVTNPDQGFLVTANNGIVDATQAWAKLASEIQQAIEIVPEALYRSPAAKKAVTA